MKTIPKYFKITINATTSDELATRIADCESRGFELVASEEVECDHGYTGNSSYTDTEGVRRRYKVGSMYRTYRAEMRRLNRDSDE